MQLHWNFQLSYFIPPCYYTLLLICADACEKYVVLVYIFIVVFKRFPECQLLLVRLIIPTKFSKKNGCYYDLVIESVCIIIYNVSRQFQIKRAERSNNHLRCSDNF